MSLNFKLGLRATWDLTLSELEVIPTLWTEDLWNQIQESYQEPHRHYHTLKHIEEVLQNIDMLFDHYRCYSDLSNHTVPRGLVRLATFFHDIVYDVKDSAGSVKTSAGVAEHAAIFMGLSNKHGDMVRELVQLTELHEINPSIKIASWYQKIFLDSDMAILGSEPDVYLEYIESVRKEYCPPYSNEDFRLGRTSFLKGIENKRLFYTDMMEEKLGFSAHRNIGSELKCLTSPLWTPPC